MIAFGSLLRGLIFLNHIQSDIHETAPALKILRSGLLQNAVSNEIVQLLRQIEFLFDIFRKFKFLYVCII